MITPTHSVEPAPPAASAIRWYQGVTRAQWLILLIASAGQIFNVTRSVMLPGLLDMSPADPSVKFWGEVFLGIALIGGAVGGTYFGSLSDRIGRKQALIITILIYTFACVLIGLAQSAWQVAVCRFFVSVGTAGGWAIGASLVAEVFSARSRAQAGAVFHSTSNIGVGLASVIGIAVGTDWRLAYFIGFVPIFLVFFLRSGPREPPGRKEETGASGSPRPGSLRELLTVPEIRARALLGMLLAAVGIGTYWSISVGGQDMVEDFLLRHGYAPGAALSRAQFAYGFLINGGGFVGALSFGPFAQWLGRRKAFACALLGGMLIVPATCYLPQTYGEMLVLLPVFGLMTFGYHAGFAFYFPELFPTHLRGTGAGFCFNCGRPLAALFLGLSGWLKSRPFLDIRGAMCLLALLYLLGIVCVWFLPETKNENLNKVF